MKFTATIAISALTLSLASCGSRNDAATTSANETVASDTMPDIAMSEPAGMGSDSAMAASGQAFADTAASIDAFEIATSKLAADKASGAKVKTFAQQMIKAHTDSTAKLKTAAAAASPAITPVPQMTAMQQQVLDDLKTKSGAAFDTAYMTAQANAHQMTLDKLKGYAANGDVPSLKAFASEMIPIVTGHLNMAKGM